MSLVPRALRTALALVTTLASGLILADTAAAATTSSKITAQVTGTTLTVTGTNGSDDVTLVLAPGGAAVDVLDNELGVIVASVDRATFDAIDVVALGGNDRITASDAGGVFTDTETTTLDGGPGNDTLVGASGNERISGGDGNDFVDANRGDDVVLLGAGNDTFQWDPGDGSDVVEGESGADTMLFNGANVSEHVDVTANGSRVRFTRDVGAITMDLDGVETVGFGARGGADVVHVGDLAGTDVTDVNVGLEGIPGTTTGDGAADQVIVDGTAAADTLSVSAAGGHADVSGVAAAVHVTAGELANDTLTVAGLGGDDAFAATPASGSAIRTVFDGGPGVDTVTTNGTPRADAFTVAAGGGTDVVVSDPAGASFELAAEHLDVNGLGGDDSITAGNGLATRTSLTLSGGPGNDTILGGDGADVIDGGSGRDFVDGNIGNDIALLGSGSDTLQWDPGDGSDVVEGQSGNDTLLFNGSNAAEHIALSANGARLRLVRDVGAITMDVDGVENVTVAARGSADVVTVGDLTGTAVRHTTVDLAAFASPGTGDGAADDVIVTGTAGDDRVTVAGDTGAATVTGLATTVTVAAPEFANDRLDVDTGGGDDRVRSRLAPGVVALFVDGAPA